MVAYGTCTQHPRPNLHDTDVYCFGLIFTLHFVTDSKGTNTTKCPKSEKNGKYLTSFIYLK